MATSINWGSKVINVLRADLTLVQSVPTEIRELNLNSFRLDLKNLEDNELGMPHLNTHNHNTEVLLGGIVYARVIEIINGYTVTFEDGQYAVNLVGANSNVGDVVNVNQVSVRSQNSAGLISNQAIEFSSFNGGVTIDITNITGQAVSGTVFPAGTRQAPCDNLSDAALIASRRGLSKIYIIGNITLDNTASWERFEFAGESAIKTTITVLPAANVLNCEFYECNVTGTLDGNSQIERGVINNLDFVDGFIFRCAIGPSLITLGTSTNANIFSCYSTIPGQLTPVIDMNSTGLLGLRDYNGGIKLINYSGTGSHSIDLASGQVILDSTSITSGTFITRGIGNLSDENGTDIRTGVWNGGVTIINELVNNQNVTEAVWNAALTDYTIVGSTGEAQSLAAAGGGITESGIADAVWEEATVDHQTPGTTGKALSDAGGAGNPWDIPVGTPVSGSYGEFVTKKLLTFAKWIGLR